MECEKPKSRKKKKSKVVAEEKEETSSIDSFELDMSDLKELCTEINKNQESEACASNAQEISPNNNEEITQKEEEISRDFEECPPPSASAPIADISESTSYSFAMPKTKVELYPDLKQIEMSSNDVKEKIFSPAAMKPFTMTQLESFYSNSEIKLVEIFEAEFNEKELKDSSLQDHQLYVLLKKYAKSRLRFLKNKTDADGAMKKLERNYKDIWGVQSRVASTHGFCSCGRVLRATHNFNYAIFSEETFGDMEQNMKSLLTISSQNHVKFMHECHLYYQQIDHLVNGLINDAAFKDIKNDSPIALRDKIENSQMLTKINDLRTYVSVLFKFLREMPQDRKTQVDVQLWIKQLVSLQLRIATWEDHVFILFHILRCRDGIGWASCLVQIPMVNTPIARHDLLGSPDFHHCIAILNVLLMPVTKRMAFLEEYLKDVVASKAKSEKDLWILVDSDGEEGSSSSNDYSKLKESDLVVLFDQIPFELIFKAMTFAYKNDDSYELDMERILFGHNVIKTIAFCSKFINIIKSGMLSTTEHHKQFAKRLGKLIKQTLLYLSDIVAIYQKSTQYQDPDEYQRIQIEYNELVCRSACFIYESKKLSLFQYLADFPYELVSTKDIWKLFYCLHIGDFKTFDDESPMKFDNVFIDNFSHDIAMDDMIFLLHTFAKMALSKGNDLEFVSFVLKDLINIGFINDFTKDFCYNTVKGLVTDITMKFTDLVSEAVAYIKSSLHSIGSLNTYVLKALPLNKWKPSQYDLELFSSWLLHYDFDTLESSTARFIISSINWDFDGDNQLFLPHEIHVSMAHLVCEVYLKYVDEQIKTDFNETKFLGKLTKNSSKKDKFSVWCWTMVSLLRLHQIDINPIGVINNLNILNTVPDFEKLNMVYQGATEKKPLAIYISFLLSQYGHSIPQICLNGFEQLKILLSDHRYPKVIRCLELVVPLYLQNPASLHECESFLTILNILVKADKANAIKDSNFCVLKLLMHMILNQLNSYQKYGLITPWDITYLWINSFIQLKNWHKDDRIIWIVENICQFAYPFIDVWKYIKEMIRPHVQTIAITKLTKSTGLLSLVMSEEFDILYTPSDDAPVLSLIILECEHENIEVNTGYWNDLIYQLSVQRDLTLDNVHKSILQTKHMTFFPLKTLVIFKLVRLITNCSMNSFIFPILCQQFFTLYYSRVFIDIANDSRGVQEKFYDYDIPLMKRMKKKFEETEKYHLRIATEESSGEDSFYHTNLSKIFKTFLLWLEETQLSAMMQKNVILPPQYEGQRLKQIFQGNKNHWTEYINLQQMRVDQKQNCDFWMRFCLRMPSLVNICEESCKEDETDEDKQANAKRICERLKLSGKGCKPPPELIRKSLTMKKIDLSSDTIKIFRNEANILKKSAHQYMQTINEHKAVDAVYRDSIRYAYSNEPTFRMKQVTCSRLIDNCQRSLSLKLEFCEMKPNDNVKLKLEDNREYHRKLIAKEMKDCDQKIIDANFCLENILEQLVNPHNKNNGNASKISKMILYELIDESSDPEILEYPITNEFYSNAIKSLGSFVQKTDGSEMPKILKVILQRPLTINLFTEIFAPSNLPTATFIRLYECLVNLYAKNYEPQVLFVLVSKFDMPTFLQAHRPKLVEVSELIKLIFRGLELWTIENSELLQDALRCHLVHLFMHRFPEHYGEILQSILSEFSQQRLRPCILLDVLNAFYQRVGCNRMDTEMSVGRMKDEMRIFASKQNLLHYNDLHSTTLMLNHYFFEQRLQHGLHGIYPKFSKYCDVLMILYGTIGHSVISAAIRESPDASADFLVNQLYPCISNLFAPMLVPLYYSPNNSNETPAIWIQQLSAGNTVLQPFSNVQSENAEKFIRAYAMCLQYMFDMLPASNLLIQHLFTWYIEYFAHKTTPNHVLMPIQLLLTKMPFERFLPTLQHLEGINRVLMEFAPDCHTFLGNIFLRIPWSQWLSTQLQSDYMVTQRILAILLMTIVKLSYEPKVRESIRILQLLQETIQYPWMNLDYKDVENVLDWFVMSAEPSVILKIPSEHESVDANIHILLQTVSCMHLDPREEINHQHTIIAAKRMAYVRSIVRILKSCDAKLHQLLSTQKGQQLFNDTFVDFLNLIDSHVLSEVECTSLIVTITENMSVPESVANLFSSGIQTWQNGSKVGSLTLSCFLNALRVQNIWTMQMFQILETTLFNYMRVSDSVPTHTPSWDEAIKYLPLRINFELQPLINSDLHLTIFFLSVTKMTSNISDSDRLEYLMNLKTKLSAQKTTEPKEPGYCLVMCFLLMSYARLLKRTEDSKSQLMILANHLLTNYNQTEGWGDGFLGAIGFKKDPESNDKKILMRCLACGIYALISTDIQFHSSIGDLKTFLNQKKFAEIKMKGLQALSLIESKRTTMNEGFFETMSKVLRIFYSDSYLNDIEKLFFW